MRVSRESQSGTKTHTKLRLLWPSSLWTSRIWGRERGAHPAELILVVDAEREKRQAGGVRGGQRGRWRGGERGEGKKGRGR